LCVAAGVLYESLVWFGWGAMMPRFPTPYAVPIFDVPFALVAVGVAYLCLERHRLRQDARSAGMGTTLWLTALLALAHVFAQPDYPANPGVNPGIAPYFCFLSYFAGYFLLAAFIWNLGLLGFLLYPFRYSIPWYLLGFARPLGVGVIFVGLLREQVWLYREARARQRDLDVLHRAGQALVRSLDL